MFHVLTFRAVRKEVADLVDDLCSIYKCLLNRIADIDSLTCVRSAPAAERVQVTGQINASVATQNRSTMRVKEFLLCNQCVPSFAFEARKMRAEASCLTSELTV